MSVSSIGASSNAYAYLQSLLQQQRAGNQAGTTGTVDPLTALLGAFYPNGNATQPTTPASAQTTSTSPVSSTATAPLSPDTMASLISMQGQDGVSDPVAARAQSLFGQIDANGDGSTSKSEFENIFGPNADTSKVDGLFAALDANGDGSISQDELTAAAEQSQAERSHGHHHHHHHMQTGDAGQSGPGASDPLQQLMTDLQGATTKSSTNSDGSTTTTISYADGSTVTLTTPAAPTSGGPANSGSTATGFSTNALERLIQLQSQLLAPATTSAGVQV